jgi:hypothetical protein
MTLSAEVPKVGDWWHSVDCLQCGALLPIIRDPHGATNPSSFNPESPGGFGLGCQHCGYVAKYGADKVKLVQIKYALPPLRNGPFATHQGAYDQVIKVLQPVIDPGEIFEAHHYFVGYGLVLAAKVQCWPSAELFEARQSRVDHNLGYIKEEGAFRPYWGRSTNVPAEGFQSIVIGLGGFGIGVRKEGDVGTSFVDDGWPHIKGGSVPRLWTEANFGGSPPVRYKFKTRRDIKPGKYFVEFNFTYHDGKGWKSTSKRAEFHVRNFLERYAVQLGVFGSAAAAMGLAKATGLLDLVLGLFKAAM